MEDIFSFFARLLGWIFTDILKNIICSSVGKITIYIFSFGKPSKEMKEVHGVIGCTMTILIALVGFLILKL